MKNRFVFISLAVILVLSIGLGAYAYPHLPERPASHWGTNGQPDGFTNRLGAVALMPAILIAINILFLVIPSIDPLKENIAEFRSALNGFIVGINIFFLYIHGLTLFWNMGYKFNLTSMMIPAMGIFIFMTGNMIQNAKKNYFIGIRTPWTLANETVWDKTHQLGGKLYKIAGGITILGFIFPNRPLLFLLAPILGASLFSVLYSYFAFRKELPSEAK